MSDAAEYAYVNARIHALMSSMLSETFYERLTRAPSFEEGLYLFQTTPYRFISSIYSRSGDLKLVEKSVAVFLYDDIRRLRRHAPDVLRPLVDVLLLRMQFDAFKTAFRLWFDQVFRKRSIADYAEYIPRDIPLEGISPDDIINAPSIEELTARLSHTPYAFLIEAISKLRSDQNLLRTELLLSSHWFLRLQQVVATFSSEEHQRLQLLIAEEIDSINLERIIRVVPHLQQGESSLALCIPGGRVITPADFALAEKPAHRQAVYGALLEKFGVSPARGEHRPSYDFGATLSQLRQKQLAHRKTLYRRVKIASIFDAGLCLVYTRLRELEAERIVQTLYARYYQATDLRTAT